MARIDLREGGRLFDSPAMTAYVREQVAFAPGLGSQGDYCLFLTNRGEQMAVIAPERLFWILHCEEGEWQPLRRHESAGGFLFISPGETARVLAGPLLDGFVLVPGHRLQAAYVGFDGTIIKLSPAVAIDDRVLEKARPLSVSGGTVVKPAPPEAPAPSVPELELRER